MDGKLEEINEEQWNVKPQPHFSIPSSNPPYFLSTKQQTHWKNTITIYLFSEQTHLKNPYFLHHLVIYLNENKNKKWNKWVLEIYPANVYVLYPSKLEHSNRTQEISGGPCNRLCSKSQLTLLRMRWWRWYHLNTTHITLLQQHKSNLHFVSPSNARLEREKVEIEKEKAWGERWSKEAHHGFGSTWEKELGV